MLVLGLGLTLAAQSSVTCPLPADDRPPIVMNQTGFERTGPKIAVLRTDADHPVAWTLFAPSGSALAQGRTQPLGFDPSAGAGVHRIDFSALDTAASDLQIEACGVRSRPFSIGATPYSSLAEDSLRYFYLNRLGVEIEPEFAGAAAWSRAAGFVDSEATCFFGADKTGTEWPGCDYTLPTSGGWADAGDYGQYVVNGGIAVWTLQFVFERFDLSGELDRLGWNGNRVALPDTPQGLSEILTEARWQVEFMLALQIPDGQHVWVDQRSPESSEADLVQIDGSGLVHHKLHERRWLPLPLLPEDAHEARYLIPPSTAATLNLAAVAAQCSRVWRAPDPAFAARCLSAAERAFQAAQRHPNLLAFDTFEGGGAYGDQIVADEFYWAAVELHLATGDPAYLDVARTRHAEQGDIRPVFWANTELLATLSASLQPDANPMASAARSTLLDTARRYQADMITRPYYYPLPPSQITWGSNANLLNRALVMLAAHDVDSTADFRDGAVHALDYLLGRNPLDQSYIAGYGARPMRTPHHRFWAHGSDPEFPEAPPGALSGGPNYQVMTDPVARAMDGRCAPQTCWADHVDAYSLNEVAINWNAPLFAVAAILESTERPLE